MTTNREYILKVVEDSFHLLYKSQKELNIDSNAKPNTDIWENLYLIKDPNSCLIWLCLFNSNIPDKWYNALVKLIHNKPITLLSHLYKLFTRIIISWMENKLDFYQPIAVFVVNLEPMAVFKVLKRQLKNRSSTIGHLSMSWWTSIRLLTPLSYTQSWRLYSLAVLITFTLS